MEKQLIKSFEFGAAKNGATLSLLPELNCILLEWKGDVLLEEWIEILSKAHEEVDARKITNWIGDTTNLGATAEEHDRWVQEVFTQKIIKAGLRKLVVVLSNDVLGEMAMQELMDNFKNSTSSDNSQLQTTYTKDIGQALEWIRSN